jgi:hypothetical protein
VSDEPLVIADLEWDGEEWVAQRDLNKLTAALRAAQALVVDGYRVPIPLAPHQAMLWVNLEQALAVFDFAEGPRIDR